MEKSAGDVIVSYVSRLPRPVRRGEVTTAEFERVRTLVVNACRKYGAIGPDPAARKESCFYVVDDQYDNSRRIMVETNPGLVTSELIAGIAMALSDTRAWDVLLEVADGITLLIRTDSVLVTGFMPSTTNLVGAMKEVRECSFEIEDRKREVRARRLAEVTHAVEDVWRSRGARALVLVAVFRDRSDGVLGDSVWLLHGEEEYAMDLDDYSFYPEAQRLSTYWVDPPCTVVPYGSCNRPSPASSILVEWILVAEGRPLTGVNSLRVTKCDQVWDFSLCSH